MEAVKKILINLKSLTNFQQKANQKYHFESLNRNLDNSQRKKSYESFLTILVSNKFTKINLVTLILYQRFKNVKYRDLTSDIFVMTILVKILIK